MPMVQGNQIQADIEFAGQTLDQKRKSIKAMSKQLNNDSTDLADDLHKEKRPAFVVHDGAQLQSMASMNQVTDTDEPADKAKKQSS